MFQQALSIFDARIAKILVPRPNKFAFTRSAPQPTALLDDIRQLILAAGEGVARAVNSSLVILYWQIGQRTRKEILHHKRAEYGEMILHALSAKLAGEFGRGFAQRNLFNTKDHEHVELLEIEKAGIHVARYLTKFLPKKPLQRKLHEAVRLACARLAKKVEPAKQIPAPEPRRRKN